MLVARMVRRVRYGVMDNTLFFTILLEIILHFAAEQKLVDKTTKNYDTAIKVGKIVPPILHKNRFQFTYRAIA